MADITRFLFLRHLRSDNASFVVVEPDRALSWRYVGHASGSSAPRSFTILPYAGPLTSRSVFFCTPAASPLGARASMPLSLPSMKHEHGCGVA